MEKESENFLMNKEIKHLPKITIRKIWKILTIEFKKSSKVSCRKSVVKKY